MLKWNKTYKFYEGVSFSNELYYVLILWIQSYLKNAEIVQSCLLLTKLKYNGIILLGNLILGLKLTLT